MLVNYVVFEVNFLFILLCLLRFEKNNKGYGCNKFVIFFYKKRRNFGCVLFGSGLWDIYWG